MNRLERMTLIKLAMCDLDDAVISYAPGYGKCEKWCTKESIKRRIMTIRADLKQLERELSRPCRKDV